MVRLLPICVIFLVACVSCKDEPSLLGSNNDNNENNRNNTNNLNNENNTNSSLAEIDPGRVTIHRLNRAEYNNTIRDLFHDRTAPASSFPDDDFGGTFNNVADVLSTSTLHIEMYDAAARGIVDRALIDEVDPSTTRYEAESWTSPAGGALGEEFVVALTGEVATYIDFPASGDFLFRIRARQNAAGPDPANMVIKIDGVQVFSSDVSDTFPTEFSFQETVTRGRHELAFEFTNDFNQNGQDRDLILDWVEVVGPAGGSDASLARTEIVTCTADTSACRTEIFGAFLLRAWRRPPTDDEIERLVMLAETKSDFERGIALGLRAALLSPHFIFRVEIDPDPDDETPHSLNSYELANRLSYFLWSSMPDETLFELAADDSLQDPAILQREVDRMLDHENASALVDQFATQWLFIDMVLDVNPDYETFPEWSDSYKSLMRTESRMFFENLVAENSPIRELVTGKFSYLNDELAQFYGQSEPGSDTFSKVDLNEQRFGFLTQGVFLSVNARSKRNAPVLRGFWILENLLCDEPDDIPDDVIPLQDMVDFGELTVREVSQFHSTNPACARCHREMDPLGFGFEHFDAVGAWRDFENGKPVDASGVLPPNLAFDGVGELSEFIVADQRFARCVTEKVLSYGLGRGVESWDAPQIEALEIGPETGMRDLIKQVVLSEAFRDRRGGTLQDSEGEN